MLRCSAHRIGINNTTLLSKALSLENVEQLQVGVEKDQLGVEQNQVGVEQDQLGVEQDQLGVEQDLGQLIARWRLMPAQHFSASFESDLMLPFVVRELQRLFQLLTITMIWDSGFLWIFFSLSDCSHSYLAAAT